MAPTIVWGTGFEQGCDSDDLVNVAGIFTSTSGGAAITLDTGTVRTGAYSLRLNPAGAATTMVQGTAFSGTRAVGRFYFRFNTLPSATFNGFFAMSGVAGQDPTAYYHQPTGQIMVGFNTGSDFSRGGPVIAANTWYRLDMTVNFNDGAGNKTIDWQIAADGDVGEVQSQVVIAEASTTFQLTRFGNTATPTYDIRIDDAVVSQTLADYPIGDGYTLGVSPNADGTHSGITAGDFTDEAAANIVVGTTTAWTNVSTVPWQTVNHIVQVIARAAYIEIQFADITLPGDEYVQGVIGQLGYGGNSATGHDGATYASADDFSTTTTIHGTVGAPVDMSETSLFTKWAVIAPPGGSWSEAEVDNLEMRIGQSGDATPDVWWDALMFEVFFALTPAVAADNPFPFFGGGYFPTEG